MTSDEKAEQFGHLLHIVAVTTSVTAVPSRNVLEVTSPTSGQVYEVRANGTCSCPGGHKPGRCWHVKAILRNFGDTGANTVRELMALVWDWFFPKATRMAQAQAAMATASSKHRQVLWGGVDSKEARAAQIAKDFD
jgi:hypothetical protein